MLTVNDYEKCKNAFDEYVNGYDFNDSMIDRKYHHSYTVVDLMEELSKRLKLSEEETNLAKIIGLLHDIGRFEQAKKYHSFSDNNMDHADASCYYLFDEGHIKDFVEPREYDEVIEHAIRYHNKFSIPNVEEGDFLFSKMIRDMDKVDIFKQLSTAYQYRFGYDEITEKILDDFNREKTLSLKEVKGKSDRVLLVLAFVFDMNFKESLDILRESGNLDTFVNVVDVKEEYKEQFEESKNKVLKKIIKK